MGLVRKYFGEIPAGPPPPPIPGNPVVEPTLPQPVRQLVEGQVALPRVYAAFRIPPYGTDDFYAADVAAHLLATGKASRLYTSLVRERRLAESVVGFAFPIVTGAAMMVLWATANPGVDIGALEEALWSEVDRLRDGGAREEEVRRVVTGIEARQTIALQRVGERADQISMFTTLFDDPDRINTELDAYRAIDTAAVADLMRGHIARDHSAVLVYVPRAAQEAA